MPPTYDDVEVTPNDSKQTFFYWFEGPDFDFKWTNAPIALPGTIDGIEYNFVKPNGGIAHNESTESADAGRTSRDIRVANTNPIVRKHRAFPPHGDINATLFRQNSLGGELRQFWSGVVTETPILDGSKALIHCKHVIELVSGSEGLSEDFGPTCPYMLGTFPCPVLLTDITDPVTVISVDPDNMTVEVSGSALIAGKYNAGILLAPNTDARAILLDAKPGANHIFSILQNFPSTTLKNGDQAFAIRGCTRLISACRIDFGPWTGNGAAFGGNNLQKNKNPHENGRIE